MLNNIAVLCKDMKIIVKNCEGRIGNFLEGRGVWPLIMNKGSMS